MCAYECSFIRQSDVEWKGKRKKKGDMKSVHVTNEGSCRFSLGEHFFDKDKKLEKAS